MIVNQVISLKGLSQKGKNRIRELGHQWMVMDIRETVLFTGALGPWMLIASLEHPDKVRWIHQTFDADFSVLAPGA